MSEEQAQQLVSQMQMLESYFADLSQRENHLVNILREAGAASESIKNSNGNDETLIPLGLGTFVKAKLFAAFEKALRKFSNIMSVLTFSDSVA